jgi:hypothetical protein
MLNADKIKPTIEIAVKYSVISPCNPKMIAPDKNKNIQIISPTMTICNNESLNLNKVEAILAKIMLGKRNHRHNTK